MHEEEKIGKAYDMELMKRLLTYAKPYATSFIGAILLAFAATVADLGLPYVQKLAIDRYLTPIVEQSGTLSGEAVLGGLLFLSGTFLLLLLARFLFTYIHNLLLYYAGQKVMRDMRREVFEQLLRLPMDYFQKHPIGRLVTRATNDVEAINEFYSEVLFSVVKDVFMMMGILVVMFWMNWELALLVFVLSPVAYWITIEFRNRVREPYRAMRRKVAELNAFVAERISGIRTIQLFAQEDRSQDEFEQVNEDEFEARMEQLKIYAIFRPLVHFLQILATAFVIWYAGLRGVEGGAFTIGSIHAFLYYIGKLFDPIKRLSQKYNTMQKAMASSERIFRVLDQQPESYEGSPVPSGTESPDAPIIEFRDVWFSYEDDPNDEDWVLRDVSFRIQEGERLAIVGPTGGGKTTMLKLLLRWYDVNRGRILLHGMDVRELDLQQLRSKMGVVLQDVFLFSGDVQSNIQLQSDHISQQSIRQAAERVKADRMIDTLPDGYNTKIGQQGESLSEGERQLLSFARAISFDPDILLLDEATANVDSRMESVILDSMEQLLNKRTSISIAHRLTTIQNSDRILVVEGGRIVEDGTHEELLNRDQLYSALYQLQFQDD